MKENLSTVLQNWWYRQPVRTQLLLAFAGIGLCAALVAGVVSIYNARDATRIEVAASLEIAARLVRETVTRFAAHDNLDELEQHLSLQLKHLRHVRVLISDAEGEVALVNPDLDNAQVQLIHRRDPAPDWFAALVSPDLKRDEVVVPINDRDKSAVIVMGEPADEIAEAWEELSTLALVWFVINLLVLGILYYVLGRLLEPLSGLAKGLLKLEDGHYATRLDRPEVEEFALIATRFNTLAEVLEIARDENSRLYRQLIAVQEEERRELANELHDEAGPCLFGITANAASIQKAASQIGDSRARELSARVGEILSITERLKAMNRTLLKRLRPGALGRVSLTDLLNELIAGFQRRHPGTHILHSLGALERSYGEPIDLALYRSIQEGVTNAIRHGQPDNIFIEIVQEESGEGEPVLELTIRDDGKGMAPSTPVGFGLAAMRERVRSLGGSYIIESTPGKGATLRIVIPIEMPEQKQAKTGKISGEAVT